MQQNVVNFDFCPGTNVTTREERELISQELLHHVSPVLNYSIAFLLLQKGLSLQYSDNSYAGRVLQAQQYLHQ